MKPVRKSGASIAVAVAALVLTVGAPGVPSHATDAKGRCMGANACKGKGYLELTKAECSKIPGTKFKPE
jgi:hypothetical protein